MQLAKWERERELESFIKAVFEFLDIYYIYFWKRNFFENVEMFVLSNNKVCASGDSAINEFVFVWIVFD